MTMPCFLASTPSETDVIKQIQEKIITDDVRPQRANCITIKKQRFYWSTKYDVTEKFQNLQIYKFKCLSSNLSTILQVRVCNPREKAFKLQEF